jgi:uncharacterized membrane protein YccC
MQTTTTITPQMRLVGVPLSAWTFAIRILIAVVVALAASFWLQLEAAYTAAVTVAILATPTRGRALDKAYYRLIATLIGVAAAIMITGVFAQERDLFLGAVAAWVGVCVYVARLLDGNRAYAAVLSGYTVAIVAVEQMDAPGNVFETGVARGTAIAVGIAVVALVNDLMAAPDSFPGLAAQLAALHRRVRDYARRLVRDEANDAATAAGLLRDIAALRPEMSSLVLETAGGYARSAAARSAAVAMAAEVYAARALNSASATVNWEVREEIAARTERIGDKYPASVATGPDEAHCVELPSTPTAWALREFLRRDAEVQEALTALTAGARPRVMRRAPPYRSTRIALAAGMRAAAYFALPSVFFVLAGWPTTEVSLALIAVLIGLGATAPDPGKFTILACIAAPISAVVAFTIEFLVLDGVNEFALLALGLAPFIIGAAVLMTLPSRLVSTLAGVNLILMLDILAPSNPPSYNPQSFLFVALFLCLAAVLLLITQILFPTESKERRQRWIMASAHRDFEKALSHRDRDPTPEDAMFRDASRIGLIMGGETVPGDGAILAEALSYFDRAAAIRLSRASLERLVGTSLSQLEADAREALAAQDARRLRDVARSPNCTGAADGVLADEVCNELALVATVIDTAARAAAPPTETTI